MVYVNIKNLRTRQINTKFACMNRENLRKLNDVKPNKIKTKERQILRIT